MDLIKPVQKKLKLFSFEYLALLSTQLITMSNQGKFTEYKCKCGKDYFGEYKKTNMLIRMHHKICTETYMPVSGTVKLDFDVLNPKSHLGEKNKQQRIAEIVSVIKTNRVLGNPLSNV